MRGRRVLAGLVVLSAAGWEGVARAQLLSGDTMDISVLTGGDNLRGSSHAMLSVQHPDGTWSSEVEISTGGSFQGFVAHDWDTCGSDKLPVFSRYNVTVRGSWDGLDPCAIGIRVRLQQGSCFLATDDNWNMDTIDINYNLQGGGFLLASGHQKYRLTGSAPSVTVGTEKTPDGTTCRNGWRADCSGNAFDPVVLTYDPPFDNDSTCDNQFSYYNFFCAAYEYDNGACGLPGDWLCDPSWYGDGWCDCECVAWDPDCSVPDWNNPSAFVYGCPPRTSCINTEGWPGVWGPTCSQVAPP
jgi:hypothetical protein